MRAMFVAALLLVSFLPTASAAPVSLAIAAQAGPLAGNVTIPVTLHLRVSDFLCHEPHTFSIQLWTNATEGVKAIFEQSEIALPVPARAYFVEAYEAEAVVNLSVRALAGGMIEATASFNATEGPCLVPGGFTPAQATIVREVTAAIPTDPAPEARPTTNPTPDEPTSTEQGSTNASRDPPATPPTSGSPPNTPSACAPATTCGVIGEYAPVEESAAKSRVPGLGVAGSLVMGAVVALVVRRR